MATRFLGPRRSRRRQTRLLVLAGLIAAVFAVFFVAASSANLPSSGSNQFEDNDGNLVATGSNYDWNGPVPETISCVTPAPSSGTNCGLDLTGHNTDASGNGDNALGSGSKEDDTAVTLVDGSIPPSKDDLQRFYINKQFVGGKQYLYLAWERTNLLGSAHLDFEFNQAPVGITPTTPAGSVNLVRTPNDLLIDFDFGGSGQPALVLHKWLDSTNAPTNTPSADCEASNTFPCWGKGKNLTTTGFAEGAVNSASVSDTNNPSVTLDGNTKTTGGNTTVNSEFGEAGINLTDSGAFPAGTCETLGDAWVKSRSSGDSFVSELKDIVAPIPVHISNCGEIKIIKRTAPRGQDQAFGFNSTIPNPTGTITSSSSPYCQLDAKPNGTYTGSGDGGFALNDKDANTTPPAAPHDSAGNTEDCVNVQSGSYTVTEGSDPGNFTFSGLSCSATGTGTSAAQDGSVPKQANITIAGGGVATCVYTNQLHQGAISISKTSTKGGGALNGATFKISTDAAGTNVVATVTVTTGGSVCKDGLSWSGTGTTYYVTETAAPTGYKIDTTTAQSVSVDNNAKCSDNPYGGESISFTDTPLSTIEVKFTSLAGAGVTKSQIACVDGSSATVPAESENGAADGAGTVADPYKFDDTDELFGNGGSASVPHTTLVPGTYVCTVVVDP